jgi:hypothetical protein
VTFLDGMLRAVTIFKRHNYQYYKVLKADGSNQVLSLRIIQSINTPATIKIIETMQSKLLHIRHPNLIQYVAIAVEQERPLIKFMVVEEYMNPGSYISLRGL